MTGITEFDGLDGDPVPTPFVAVTVNVYEVPFVRPVTVHVSMLVVHVLLPGALVTAYPVIALPPSEVGANQDTGADALAGVAVTLVGAPGNVAGVTEFDGLDGEPVPSPLVAVTVNVYEVPLVRPGTVQLSAPLVVHILLPGELFAL